MGAAALIGTGLILASMSSHLPNKSRAPDFRGPVDNFLKLTNENDNEFLDTGE